MPSAVVYSISGRDVQADRPEPIIGEINALPFTKGMHPATAVKALLENEKVVVLDLYSSGLRILNELKRSLEKKFRNASFKEQRDFRTAYREISHHLLLEVYQHRLKVKKAPEIGWFEILYPDVRDFCLPFPLVQGLNSSWQWYKEGVFIPLTGQILHPFYGTYFPSRYEHIRLFGEWLKKYPGEKSSVYDIGIGSGVLSYQLLKYGFSRIYGTDISPNAIIGVSEDLFKKGLSERIELSCGDLFADFRQPAELIVFNPPWIPASYSLSGMDKAVYYEDDLFPRFFLEAQKHLLPEGKLVILFSNLAQLTKMSKKHPVEEELRIGGRFEKVHFVQRKVAEASVQSRRQQNWRSTEMVELWVLQKCHTV